MRLAARPVVVHRLRVRVAGRQCVQLLQIVQANDSNNEIWPPCACVVDIFNQLLRTHCTASIRHQSLISSNQHAYKLDSDVYSGLCAASAQA